MNAKSLDDLSLNGPIHLPITRHFADFPLNKDFFYSDLQRIYQLHFLTGLLTSIVSAPFSTKKYQHVFVRRIDHNMRIFVVGNKKLFFHNIFFDENKIGDQDFLRDEYTELKNEIQDFDRIMPENSVVENFVYVNEDYQSNRDYNEASMGFKLMEHRKLSISEVKQKWSTTDVPAAAELQKFVAKTRLFKSIRDQKKISINNLNQWMKILYPVRPLERHPIAKAGYIHGFLFKSLDKSYTKLVGRSPLALLSYKKAVLSMCLPSNQEANQYMMFNFGQQNIQAGHNLLFEDKGNEDITITQVNVGEEMMRYRGNSFRKVRGTLEDVLHHIQQDILVKGDHSQVYDYTETIHEFLQFMGIADIEPANFKAFLYGLMITSAVDDVQAAYKHEDDHSSVEALLIEHRETKFLLTFDGAKQSQPPEALTMEGNDIVHVNFATPLAERRLGVKISATSLDETQKSFNFEKVGPLNLKLTLQSILDRDNNPAAVAHLKEYLKSLLSHLFEESISKMKMTTEFTSYLRGIFAHYDGTKSYRLAGDGEAFLFPVSIGSDRRAIYFSVLRNEEDTAQNLLSVGRIRDQQQSLSIAYNVERKEIALLDFHSNGAKFNTENVNRACGKTARRKRASVCSFSNLDDKNEPKYNDKEIKDLIGKQNPILKNHLSQIFELSGKIQVGLMVRDVVGDLVQADMKGLVRDGFFFGGMLLAQKAGSLTINYAQKMASTSLSKSITSFGLCLPKLAFDAYMAYQMVEQIKNNDTLGASATGTFLAIDMAECALQALAAFGVITLNPIVLPIMTIASTVLLIGVNVYDTFRKVKEIDQIVHLSSEEYHYEFIREFFHMGTDSHIQHLMDEKRANAYMASKVFEAYPDIKRFLISAAEMKEDKSMAFIDDNRIDLTQKRSIRTRSRTMPDASESRLQFCAMGEEPHSKSLFEKIVDYALYSNLLYTLSSLVNKNTLQSFDDFFCNNAFGISTTDASHSEKTMFLLFDGNDSVRGFQYASNVFHIGNGSKNIRGGDQDDYFKIKADVVRGSLNGLDGYDTLDLSEYALGKNLIIQNNSVKLIQEGNSFSMKNIDFIIGRQNLSDIIHVCGQNRIDLGGTNSDNDKIFICESRNDQCPQPKNLTIYLRKNTHVVCRSNGAKITYLVMEDSNSIVESEKGSHHFHFENIKLTDINILHFNSTNLSMKFGGALTISSLSNVSIEFADRVKVQVSNDSVHAFLETPDSVFEVIEKYNEYMVKNPFLSLVAETADGTVFLNHGQHFVEVNGEMRDVNIVVDNDKLDAHLVGHKNAENYFLLFSKMSIPGWRSIDLKIHTHGATCHIDLHQFAKLIHNLTEGEYGLNVKVEQSDRDIKLNLQAVSNGVSAKTEHMGEVTIINGADHTELISVHIYGTNTLKTVDDEVSLEPMPIHINNSVTVILPGQIDFDSNIFIDRIADHMEPYFINSTLMLTNSATGAVGSVEDYTTIVFFDFLSYKNKYKTIEISFSDRKLVLRDFIRSTWADDRNINKFWSKLKQ